MFQTANTATALECPAPAAVKYVYYYTASDKHTRNGFSLGSGLSLWSSCGTGTISLIGPYSFPSTFSLAGRTVYVVQDMGGERVFTNGSYVQRVNVTGTSSQDGGDYVFYVDAPYVDYAGISMATNTEPAFDTGTFDGFSYINWFAPGDNTASEHSLQTPTYSHTALRRRTAAAAAPPFVPFELRRLVWRAHMCAVCSALCSAVCSYEAINPVTEDNVMQLTIVPYEEGQKLPSCPDTIQSTLFYYCYYADNGHYEVSMVGQLIVNALNATNGSYWVTAIDGNRTELSSAGVQQSSFVYDMTFQLDGDGQHNNRLSQSQPFIDPWFGLTLNLAVGQHDSGASNTAQGGKRQLSLLGSPPREYWAPVVNDTLLASAAPSHSYFIYQAGSPPSCPMKAKRTGLLRDWSFQYVIRSSSMAWSITCSGTLTVLGPYQQSLAPARTMYVVVDASGTRTYTDSAGQDHVTQILGLANATEAAASQLLYDDAHTDSLVPDSLGVALVLSEPAQFPGQPASAMLRLSSADGNSIHETACFSDSYLFNASTNADQDSAAGEATVSLSVDESSPTWTEDSFTVNGDSVSLQYGSGGMWLVAIVLPLLAMHAVFAIQRVALKLQSRVSQAHPWKVSGAVLVASLVYGICGVWAAELLLASTVQLNCSDCVYDYQLQMRLSNVLLALLPALLLSVPSWWLLSNAAVIVRIRKSGRVADLLVNRRKESQTITSGTVTSTGTNDSIGGRAKSKLSTTADSVADHLAEAIVMLRSNLCWITFVIALPLTAAMVLTRLTLEYGLAGPIDVQPLALSNVLSTALDTLLLWLLVAMHLSGLTWRCIASVSFPLVVLLDFYLGSLSRTVTWSSSSSSLSATKLSMTDCWWAGGWLTVASAVIIAVDVSWRLHRRRRMLENRLLQGENKLEWTRKELDAQVTMLRQLRAMYDEVVRVGDVISLARPDASVATMWQSLLALEPPVDALEKSGARCAGYQPLSAMSTAAGAGADNGRGTPLSMDPISRIKAMSSVGGSISGALRATAGAAGGGNISMNKNTESDRDRGEDTDEVGEMLQDEPIDPATQALMAMLQQADSSSNKTRDSVAITSGTTSPTGSSNPVGSPGAMLRSMQSQLPDEWRPPASFRPQLLDVMSHPACLELLKDSLKEQHCIENVMFVSRARRWADESTQRQHPQLKALLAEQIARDFIQADAPYSINIDHASRLSLLKRIKDRSLSASLFSDAEAEVRKLIAVNNWNSFTHSPAYTLCCLLLWRNAAIMRSINKLSTANKGKSAGQAAASTKQQPTVSRSGAQ